LDYSADLEIGNSTLGNITSAYTIWIFRLALQIISIILSAYSTINPILDDMLLQTFKKEQRYVSAFSYVVKIAQILIHIIYATGVVYLLQVTNIIFFFEICIGNLNPQALFWSSEDQLIF